MAMARGVVVGLFLFVLVRETPIAHAKGTQGYHAGEVRELGEAAKSSDGVPLNMNWGLSGPLKTNTKLTKMWEDLALIKDVTGRVPKIGFKTYFMSKYGDKAVSSTLKGDFEDYVMSVFDTATKLHYPAVETTLSEQDFVYAAALVGEFYFGQVTGPDELRLVSADPAFVNLNAEAANVTKASEMTNQVDGRIHEEVFSIFFVNKNAFELYTPARAAAYTVFITSLFNTVTKLCAPIGGNSKTTIDGQAFTYAALMADQFDFAGLPAAPVEMKKEEEMRDTSVEELVRQVKELQLRRAQEEDLELEDDLVTDAFS